jgi:4-amino-4-deoxy-L-arabinose transferase-like glycosyltransferase
VPTPVPTPQPAAPRARHRRRPGVLAARPAAVAALLLFAVLAVFGARVHWVEEAGSAERDGYVAQAETLLGGELPRDPFRPALYPLATAAVAAAGVPAFTAARLLSNLAAAALAWLAWWTGRRLAGPPAGWLAFALTAVNPNLWTLGQHVTTDMPFAVLAAAALAAGLLYLETPGWRPALLAGAALGLATFTRANGLFLVPPLLAAWWLAPRGTVAAAGRRVAHLAAAAGIALLVLVPHFALRAAAFGDPFHDENWKNLAFKLYGFPDWSYLERVPFAGPGELLAADPGRVVAGFAAELWRFLAGGGAAQLFGTGLHVLVLTIGAAAAVAAGGAVRRRALWLLFAGAVLLAAVAATFFTWGRLLLVLLPLGNALAAAAWGREVRGALAARGGRVAAALRQGAAGAARLAAAFGGGRVRREGGGGVFGGPRAWAVAAAAFLVLLLAAKTFLFRLPAFAERHPYATVEVLRGLAAASPPGTVLAGTSPFLGRYLDRPYLYVPDAFGPEVADPDRYYAELRRVLTAGGADYLVAGRVDLRDRPASLLGEAPPVPWLVTVPEGRAGGDPGLARVRSWRVEPALPGSAR